jgi:large subunit ribosomal protein L4
MRGGGVAFGPHKRSYRKKTPAGFRRKALCVMLSDRLRGEALHVVDELSCETPKTKPMAEMCAALAPGGKKTLLVTPEADENVYLSARNIPGVSVRPASELNALDVLHARHILLSRGAVAKLEERLA